ncbi:MAG TPA: 4'-phosphopantetheinyl transferase superfamily protein [Actinocrinis sp.]|nr:4'-phosphopantetheinyl transferase superfamily protein [Actinocrinis sp.]
MTAAIGRPGPDAADIWLISTDQPAEVLAELALLLDPAERRRAAALARPADRGRYTAAHGAVREILGCCLGTAPEDLTWERGAHGKPELAGRWTGVRANLSTCAHLAMLAVTQSRDVGVDLELVRTDAMALRMAKRYFPADEARFVAGPGDGPDPGSPSGPEFGPEPGPGCGPDLDPRAAAVAVDSLNARPAERFARLWCRKEACVKAHGARLAEGLGLPVWEAGPLVVRDPTGALPGACRVRDVPAPIGYRAAVALGGEQPFTVRWRVWHGSHDRTADGPGAPPVAVPAPVPVSVSGL